MTAHDDQIAGISARIDGIQKAQDLFQADLTRVPTTVDRQILALRELVFASLDEQASVSLSRLQGINDKFIDRGIALDAAFAAAKEATGKIEASFTKQIDSLVTIIDTKTGNLGESISDLKDRITAIENRTAGISAARGDSRNDGADLRSMAAIAVSIVAIIVVFLLHFVK